MAFETAECWQAAVTADGTPSILALTRQGVPNLRTDPGAENLSMHGGYVLSEPDGGRDVTLVATGSEVGLATNAAISLADAGTKAAVVSMPCMELFRAKDDAYRNAVLGDAPRVFIEAGVQSCWYEWMTGSDQFVGLSDFGASAPAAKLFDHFGINVTGVTAAARKAIAG